MTSKPLRSNRLVIFDLCDTLYRVNTTLGFLQCYASERQDSRIARSIGRWTLKRSPWFYLGAISTRLLGFDLARRMLVQSLAGEPKARLEACAADFVRSILPARANPPILERLKAHQAAGDEVIIVSSSLDLVVEKIAAALGVDYFASKLGFDGGLCTGRLELDLTGQKAAAISSLTHNASFISVYTDNQSDRDLLAIADQPTIVIPGGAPAKRWGGSSCEYIQL